MNEYSTESLKVQLPSGEFVSALLQAPPKPRAVYVVAHGAGAGMNHAFLAAIATGFAERGVATLRYQFLYMERGSRRPDSPQVAHAAVRAAVGEAGRCFPKLPLFAGGKSFGARMTSQAQAAEPLASVRGLVFFGFPLHPPDKPSTERAAHLAKVTVPMLFLQGTRDEFAELPLLQGVCAQLGDRATLKLSDDADHSFHVRAKSGRKDDQVRTELLDTASEWMRAVADH